MKIIHSYWSKPYLISNENTGGWSNKIFHYMSCTLSCLKFREHYEIELFTDKKGKELFIEKLQLPYTKVHVVLDNLNKYSSDLWAIGKIYTYGKQTEPFIHVDNDVYIWAKLPLYLENAGIIAQHKEVDYPHNREFYTDVKNIFLYIPSSIIEFRKTEKRIIEINAGIFGGNNIEFISKYADEAFSFINQNLDSISLLKYKGMFNTIFEQYLLYCMAAIENEEISYLLNEEINSDFLGLADFWNVPNAKTYIHTVGYYKKHYQIGEQMAQRLWIEYPDYYYRIVKLMKNGEI